MYKVLFAAAATVLLGCTGILGQTQTRPTAVSNRYVISAHAGGVNHVEGRVMYTPVGGRAIPLSTSDEIQNGENVTTGENSRAEILLNPGSFVRVASNTSFRFLSTDLSDTRVRLDRGTAIFEVFADRQFKVTVVTPAKTVTISESGVYRFDTAADGVTRLTVNEGKIALGTDSNTQVKEGRVATLTKDSITVEKIDRGRLDEFDAWSKARAKKLSKDVAQLKNKNMRTDLMRSFLGNRWNMYDSFGLWVRNPYTGFFSFLPFGYGWCSPYGYGWGPGIGWYNLPPTVYIPPHPTTPTGGTTPAPHVPSPFDPAETARRPTPPFVKMAGSDGGRRIINEPVRFPSHDRDGDMMPVRLPAPIVTSAPASENRRRP